MFTSGLFERPVHRLILAALVFWCFALSPLSRSSYAQEGDRFNRLSTESALAVFDDVWSTISERYYDPSFNGVDWTSIRDRYRTLAGKAADEQALYSVLRTMLSSLNDVHTRVYAVDEKSSWQRPRFITVGLRVRRVEGEQVVVGIDKGSDAERAGIAVGDVVISVDGSPTTRPTDLAYIEDKGKGDSTRAVTTRNIFAGRAGTVAAVKWRDRRNTERATLLKRQWRTYEPSLQVRRVGEQIALVTFDSFTDTVARQLARSLAKELKDARGIILDFRNNGGGDTEAMTEIASAFLPGGTPLGIFTARDGGIALAPQTRNANIFSSDPLVRFTGPLVILTGERTSSAAEIFTAVMKQRSRATVVGQPTCGCVLGIRGAHSLPDGGSLEISEMDYRTPAGIRLEGNPVSPDRQVQVTTQDIRRRHDRAVDEARSLLKGLIH